MPAATAGRRRLALPEADSIAALLSEVMGDTGTLPTGPPRPAAESPRAGRPGDAPAGRFLSAVNWANDPVRVPVAAGGPRPGWPADAPAGRFLSAVNWTNDPARAATAEAMSAPAADTVGERWETGGYLNQFAWD